MKRFNKQTDYKISNKYIEAVQQRCSNEMNVRTKHLSKKTLTIFLGLFITGSGIFFGLLLYRSFKMELSRQFEIVTISKALPINDYRTINRRSKDSSVLKIKNIKSSIKK